MEEVETSDSDSEESDCLIVELEPNEEKDESVIIFHKLFFKCFTVLLYFFFCVIKPLLAFLK